LVVVLMPRLLDILLVTFMDSTAEEKNNWRDVSSAGAISCSTDLSDLVAELFTSSDNPSSSPSSTIVSSTRRVRDMQVQDRAVEMRNRSAMQGQGECQMLSSPHILDMYSCTEVLVVDCSSHRYPHMVQGKLE
jgi:hypothetical protein